MGSDESTVDGLAVVESREDGRSECCREGGGEEEGEKKEDEEGEEVGKEGKGKNNRNEFNCLFLIWCSIKTRALSLFMSWQVRVGCHCW